MRNTLLEKETVQVGTEKSIDKIRPGTAKLDMKS